MQLAKQLNSQEDIVKTHHHGDSSSRLYAHGVKFLLSSLTQKIVRSQDL